MKKLLIDNKNFGFSIKLIKLQKQKRSYNEQ